MKTCSKCKVPKEEAEFYLKKSGVRLPHCKGCARAESAQRRRTKPEECKRANDQWRKENPEKARKWYKEDPEAARMNDRKKYWLDPEKARKENRESRLRNPGYWVRYKYGLSLEEWDEMILRQGGMCAICGDEAKLCIDHDHATNKVRALLCRSCNIALGKLKESARIVRAAADYLTKYSPTS